MGVLIAILTLILPVIAEVYWFIRMIIYHETLMNPYCLTIIGYLLYQFGLEYILIVTVRMIEEDDDDDGIEHDSANPDTGSITDWDI